MKYIGVILTEHLTPYHAKYFAHELTKRNSSDNLQKLVSSLMDAQVDLNPHQVEAVLFAFRSQLSSGATLADEIGNPRYILDLLLSIIHVSVETVKIVNGLPKL